MQKKEKVCLVIIDGWGYREEKKGNAIEENSCAWMKFLNNKYESYLLSASGTDVGLPSGQMGNSMVGHLTIGAGRVIPQPRIQIDELIASNRLRQYLQNTGIFEERGRLHIFGLVSDGGVHSHITHLFALIHQLKNMFDSIFVHFIADGRDTAPQSALHYLKILKKEISQIRNVKIASISGRRYTMDRDNNHDRTNEAYTMMTNGQAICTSPESYLQDMYSKGIFDENIQPLLVESSGIIREEDTILFFNYRSDRMRQIVAKCAQQNNRIYTMTQYDERFTHKFIVPKNDVPNTLAEVISKSGLSQSHIAETEKYAHVTYFFNGGREQSFEGEKRILIDSPKVESYDVQPEMSIYKVVEKCVKEMMQAVPFIVVNFANPDMVGHTGNFKATCEAVCCTDECIGILYEGCIKNDYVMIITADHGNAEIMLDEHNNIVTKHTNSMVPFIICKNKNNASCDSSGWTFNGKGTLSDIAPTILAILGLEIPKEMSGKCLFKMHE